MLICILGRQPSLGLAELEATIGSESVQPIGKDYAIINAEPGDLSQQELGGVIKIGEIITTIPSSQWNKIFYSALNEIINYVKENPSHKITFGLSAYGLPDSPKQLSNLSFALKKSLKSRGHSVRVVLGKDSALNSAQVIHNELIDKSGYEFLLVTDSKKTYLARTLSIQDIDSYSKRDFSRPKRDTKIGMMPPKLAQIMLNLAKVTPDLTVLDPFCGTGSVLMEAALKHSKIEGSDINQKMIDYTKENLEWLSKEYNINVNIGKLTCADATTHQWRDHFDCVVSETYLGRGFSSSPDVESLKTIVKECDSILTRFLTNLRPQLGAKSRCCIAVPAWVSSQGLVHLPLVDHLENLGYRRVRFLHTNFNQLVYHRPDQIVARELLVLTTR